MTEQECLQRMIAPGQERPLKGFSKGVIQILVTSSCNLSCWNCTQASQIRRKPWFMTSEQFAQAVESLRDYPWVVGLFGGNPAVSPHFADYCRILRESAVPFERRGIWCNDPLTVANATEMRQTFNPAVSNLNVHLSQRAWDLFKQGWPECHPVGLTQDSRHSPPFVAMKDVLRRVCPKCGGVGALNGTEDDSGSDIECTTCDCVGQVYDEERAWDLIASCDINQRWSAMIGVFRGELRAWFCEIAGAQAMLHQHEPDYPDTGLRPSHLYHEKIWTDDMTPGRELPWWQLPMTAFTRQVRQHCHECGVPLRGYGENSQTVDAGGREQVSATHAAVYAPKRKERRVEVVERLEQLGIGRLSRMTDYIQNSAK